jgi:aspartate/tyrosine/aromatic aminotransferase
LYGERVGALHVIPPTKQGADCVKSQLSVLQRSEISNPPSHGARIVSINYLSNKVLLINFCFVLFEYIDITHFE